MLVIYFFIIVNENPGLCDPGVCIFRFQDNTFSYCYISVDTTHFKEGYMLALIWDFLNGYITETHAIP